MITYVLPFFSVCIGCTKVLFIGDLEGTKGYYLCILVCCCCAYVQIFLIFCSKNITWRPFCCRYIGYIGHIILCGVSAYLGPARVNRVPRDTYY